jgi:hypothetical protein
MSQQGPVLPPPPAGQSVGASSKGFFGALFDFSFNNFVTPMIVKAVYVIATVLLILGWLVWTLVTFTQSAGVGLLVLVVGAVAVIFYLALIRMTMEFYLAIVRMSEDIHRRLPG